MQGNDKARKQNYLKRPTQRSLERREKRKRSRARNPEQAIDEDKSAIADLKLKYGKGPFLAADAVVQSRDGHILLIRRGKAPQRGFHALPGGKLDNGETFYQAALRELKEETGLVAAVDGQVKQIDWDSALAGYVVNDQPGRDPRGRWISVAYYFVLPFNIGELHASAGDDAMEAEWVRIEDFPGFADDQFFADHLEIVRGFAIGDATD